MNPNNTITFDNPIENNARTEIPCIGQYFRYIETAFIDKRNAMVFTKSLRPLKRISCPGCAECGAELDYVKETISEPHFIQFNTYLESGSVVMLKIIIERDLCAESEESYYEVIPAPAETSNA